jgi:GT2 family glycosyltransferase
MKIGVAYAAYISNPVLLGFAVDSLRSIQSAEHELVFVGHSNHSMPAEWQMRLESFGPIAANERNNLSRAWNRGIQHCFAVGCEYVFVPNLDIICASWSLDALIAAAQRRPQSLVWTMSTWGDLTSLEDARRDDVWRPYPHFSAWLIGRTGWNIIGPLDEAFDGAYDEDLDYHVRIMRAGYTAEHYEGARFFHHGSVTVQQDSALREFIIRQHAANDAYFRRKWKEKPDVCCDGDYSGMHEYPFNDPTRVGFEARDYPPTWP